MIVLVASRSIKQREVKVVKAKFVDRNKYTGKELRALRSTKGVGPVRQVDFSHRDSTKNVKTATKSRHSFIPLVKPSVRPTSRRFGFKEVMNYLF